MDRAFQTTDVEVVYPTVDELLKKLDNEFLGRGPRRLEIERTFDIGHRLDDQGCLRIRPKRWVTIQGVKAKVDSYQRAKATGVAEQEETGDVAFQIPAEVQNELDRLEELMKGLGEVQAGQRRAAEKELKAATPSDRLWAKTRIDLGEKIWREKTKAKSIKEDRIIGKFADKVGASGKIKNPTRFNFIND